jgi:hypothetical protein
MVEMQVKTVFPISKSNKATIYEPGFIGEANSDRTKFSRQKI